MYFVTNLEIVRGLFCVMVTFSFLRIPMHLVYLIRLQMFFGIYMNLVPGTLCWISTFRHIRIHLHIVHSFSISTFLLKCRRFATQHIHTNLPLTTFFGFVSHLPFPSLSPQPWYSTVPFPAPTKPLNDSRPLHMSLLPNFPDSVGSALPSLLVSRVLHKPCTVSREAKQFVNL